MPTAQRTLRPVPPRDEEAAPAGGTPPARADLPLDVVILLVGLFPLLCQLAGLGSWDALTLGLGTLGVLFATHDLLSIQALRPRPLRPPRRRTTGRPPRGDP